MCRASRVRVLNDAAEYFGALRQTLLRAERHVQIIGWDIHSETCLVGPSGRADDNLPITLGPFLKALVAIKPGLRIDILTWDYAALYAAEREWKWNSQRKFTCERTGRIRFNMDSSLPLGSAQHQKMVVVDGAVAFVGGLDLTIRRWDTSEHRAQHPFRIDPDGRPYPPFHDVQCMVDGEAAKALAELARRRWEAAGCPSEPIDCAARDLWPPEISVQAREIPVGILRTEVGYEDRPAVREVARLFARSIEAARRFIYIENQFTSATSIAEALARRMQEVPALRVLIVTPKAHASWLESQTMQGGRSGFIAAFTQAGVADRVRILYPAVRDGSDTVAVMIHSKVMIVDNDFLRIGSANLNNRSMGVDSECDLAFEATCEDHRRFIRAQRRRLIAHFCDLYPEQLAAGEDDLFAFLDNAAAGSRIALRPIDCEPSSRKVITDIIQPIADPKQPLRLERAARRVWTRGTALTLAGIALALAGLALAWRYTALRDYADIAFLSGVIASYSGSIWAPLYAIAAFVLGGLVVFPVIVLIAATAAALGPWLGAATAATGVLLSATILFLIGRLLGHERLQSLMGRRALRIQGRIIGKGVIAVALIRMVPIAPFSVVNVLAGASKLRLTDFLLGTAVGMAPGIVTMAALGSQIADFAKSASWWSALLVGLTILLWIAVCLGVQFLVTWLAGRRT